MHERFTLVIPTYNEAAIIRETLLTIIRIFDSRISIPWRIIVADNASTDNTVDIVKAFPDYRVRVVRLEEKGRGRAIRAGFAAARGGIVAFTDADLSVDPVTILRGLGIVFRGESEIVIGSRFLPESDTGARPLLRNVISHIFHALASIITGLRASDSQCPLKMVSQRMTPVMLETRDPTWWSELEFVLLAEKLGVTVKEIPVAWIENRYASRRKSTVKIVQDGCRAIVAMLKIRLHLPRQVEMVRSKILTSTAPQ